MLRQSSCQEGYLFSAKGDIADCFSVGGGSEKLRVFGACGWKNRSHVLWSMGRDIFSHITLYRKEPQVYDYLDKLESSEII
jgi:hypothetical protein